jgi:hypothetical protein
MMCCHYIRSLQKCLFHQPLLLFSHHQALFHLPQYCHMIMPCHDPLFLQSQPVSRREHYLNSKTLAKSAHLREHDAIAAVAMTTRMWPIHSHQGSYTITQTFLRKARRASAWKPECTSIKRNKLLETANTFRAVS